MLPGNEAGRQIHRNHHRTSKGTDPANGAPLESRQVISRLDRAEATLLRVYRGKAIGAGRRINILSDVESAWLVLRGKATIVQGDEVMTVMPGHWLWLAPGRREQYFSVNCELLSVNYFWKDAEGRLIQPARKPLTAPSRLYPRLLAAAGQLVRFSRAVLGHPAVLLPSTYMFSAIHLELRSMFLAWLAENIAALTSLGRAPIFEESMDDRLRQFCTRLESTPLHGLPDYTKMAGECKISRAQLERLFRTVLASSPHAHFERRRFDYARQELLAGTLTIKEIASNLGFRHLSRFSAWFSRREHISPRGYRAKGSVIG